MIGRSHLRLPLLHQPVCLEQALECDELREEVVVCAGAVSLEGVPVLRDVPLDFVLRPEAVRNAQLDAAPGRLDELALRMLLRHGREKQSSVRACLHHLAVPAG